jgi:hypothetical protein
MVVDCASMEPYRNSCDLGPFMRFYRTMKPQFSSVKIFALYLNDQNPDQVKKRSLALYSMKVGWHKLMKIDL